MLSYRKDNATDNKLVLYWDKRPVPKDEYDKYWMEEVDRLKGNIEEEKKKTDAMLKCADSMLNKARETL